MKNLFYMVVLCFSSLVLADSFSSIEGFPYTRQLVRDYTTVTQSASIEHPAIGAVLYPVRGFPALVEKNNTSLTVILKTDKISDTFVIELSKSTRGMTSKVFTRTEAKTVAVQSGLVVLEVFLPEQLPTGLYDLAVTGNMIERKISQGSVAFVAEGPLSFALLADSQIEDLQALDPRAEFNFNSKEYPFQSDSVLDFSKQEGIIKTAFSELSCSANDISMFLGDLVFGVDYQREYDNMTELLASLDLPIFIVPGNHDGYAKFEIEENLSSPLEWDGLEFFSNFFGPLWYSFTLKGREFLMLNTYDGTPQRRAGGKALGLGDYSAVPVSNYGGFLSDEQFAWISDRFTAHEPFALFAHHLPLGIVESDNKYHMMEKYPANKYNFIDHEEWNAEGGKWDSNPLDSLFGETDRMNRGVVLTTLLANAKNPVHYYSGHAHRDHDYYFKPGDEIIKSTGITSSHDVDLMQTTTLSGSGELFWGMRVIRENSDGSYTKNFACAEGNSCSPIAVGESAGFQSEPLGNLWCTYSFGENKSHVIGGNGAASTISFSAVNFLPESRPLRLKFLLPAGKGYALSGTEGFSIAECAASLDGTLLYMTVEGVIDSPVTLDEFILKAFKKAEVSCTVAPKTEAPLVPEITYTTPEKGEPLVLSVANAEQFKRLSWERNGSRIAEGATLTIPWNKLYASEQYKVVSLDSACGLSENSVMVEVDITATDDSDITSSDNAAIDTAVPELDTDISAESDADNNSGKRSSGCSLVI